MREQFLQRASAGAAGSVSESRISRTFSTASITICRSSGVNGTSRRRREEK